MAISKQPLSLEGCVRRLKAINYALENLQVKGRDNMDILLGSMQAIDQVALSIEKGMTDMTEASSSDIGIRLATEEEMKNE